MSIPLCFFTQHKFQGFCSMCYFQCDLCKNTIKVPSCHLPQVLERCVLFILTKSKNKRFVSILIHKKNTIGEIKQAGFLHSNSAHLSISETDWCTWQLLGQAHSLGSTYQTEESQVSSGTRWEG